MTEDQLFEPHPHQKEAEKHWTYGKKYLSAKSEKKKGVKNEPNLGLLKVKVTLYIQL